MNKLPTHDVLPVVQANSISPTSSISPAPLADHANSGQPLQLQTRQIFLVFSRLALSGFGGVMPFVYRALVEQYRWLTAAEFARFLALSQILPGPTICNVALMVGKHFAGLRGAMAALAGLLIGPFLLVIALGCAYQRFGQLAIVQNALLGMSAVATGLILATGIKMALSLFARRSKGSQDSQDKPQPVLLTILQMGLLLFAFVGLGLLKWPLIAVFAILAIPGCISAYLLKKPRAHAAKKTGQQLGEK